MPSSTLPLRHNRDFLFLWGGEVISTLGSQISLIAFPLLVLATTHSAVRAGLVGFANQVPVLAFYLPAGVLVDRHDRRVIMAVSSVVGGLALASVPVAIAIGTISFAQILIVAALAGTRQVFYSVAEQGALPRVVDPSQLPEAVARNQARSEAATLIGPPLGGLLFGLARLLPFAVDAVSYLAAAAGALLVRGSLQDTRAVPRRQMRQEITEALQWFWSQSLIRTSAVAVAASNFTWMALELVIIVRARQDHASPTAVGLMVALIGIGGLAGSVIAPAAVRRLRAPFIVIGLFWFEAILIPLLALSANPFSLGAIMGLAAVGGPAWNAVIVGARLSLTPDQLRGRVISIARLTSGSMLALGPLIGGLLAQRLGTTTTILLLAGWQLLVALGSAATRPLRTDSEYQSPSHASVPVT
jgi:MFS family permease